MQDIDGDIHIINILKLTEQMEVYIIGGFS